LLDAQLFGVRRTDAWWLIPAIAAAICAASLAAAIPPARRAATADPLTALRIDGS
jgi:ABC-type lipoprotein release transport system permease subunit